MGQRERDGGQGSALRLSQVRGPSPACPKAWALEAWKAGLRTPGVDEVKEFGNVSLPLIGVQVCRLQTSAD